MLQNHRIGAAITVDPTVRLAFAEVSVRLRPALSILSVMALGLTSAVDAHGQASPSQSGTPTYQAHARDVLVDVVVAKGNDGPVEGLRKEDFQILEDGKPQTIDYFEEHISGILPPTAVAPLPQMPPGVYTNVPQLPQSDVENVLLLDSLNTEEKDQSFVLQQILAFLKTMPPGTRTAIFALGSSLKFVQGFTSDSSKLIAVLNDKKIAAYPAQITAYRSRSDELDDQEQVRTKIMMLGGHSDGGVDALEAHQGQENQFQYSNRIVMTFEALQALARYLANVPGRKNLLWFAGSYPVTVFPTQAQKQGIARKRGYLDQVKKTADLLTSSDVAVYPINAQGMMNENQKNVDEYVWTNNYLPEASGRAAAIESMEQLAADTGGKAFYNTNDLPNAIRHAIADGSHYYTLAYSPTNKKMDGSYRKIEVKLTGEHYKLAYRPGYNADEPSATEPSDKSTPLRTLLMPGSPDATQILFAVRAVPADPKGDTHEKHAGKNSKLDGPLVRYNVDFLIRWTDIKLDTAPGDGRTGKIQVELRAYDHNGVTVNWDGGTQMMSLDPKTFTAIQHSGIPAHFAIDLPRDKDVTLATGVYDWQTGKVGTLFVPLATNSPAQSAHDSSRN